MNPETEATLPAIGSSGGDGDAKNRQGDKTTGKSCSSNGGQGRGRCGRGGRGSQQVRGGRGRRLNHP